jgi:hypothetical protein
MKTNTNLKVVETKKPETSKMDFIDAVTLETGFIKAVLEAIDRFAMTSGEHDINPEIISYLIYEADKKLHKVEKLIKDFAAE